MSKPIEIIKVEKLTINLNGKRLELSIEDARKLHTELESALGLSPRVVTYIPAPQVTYIGPTYYPPQPSIWPTVWCGSGQHTSGALGVSPNQAINMGGLNQLT